MTQVDGVTSELAAEIASYLRNHPDAADTVEGVAQWWLARQRYESALPRVEQALEHLVATGQATRRRTADGTVLYGCREAWDGSPPDGDTGSLRERS